MDSSLGRIGGGRRGRLDSSQSHRCANRIGTLETILRIFLALQVAVTVFIFERSSIHRNLQASHLIRGGGPSNHDPAAPRVGDEKTKAAQRAQTTSEDADPVVSGESFPESFADVRRRQISSLVRRLRQSNRTSIDTLASNARNPSMTYQVLERQVTQIFTSERGAGEVEGGESLISCFEFRKDDEDFTRPARVFLRDGCKDSPMPAQDKALVIFNPHDKPRGFCDRTIPAFSAAQFQKTKATSKAHSAGLLECAIELSMPSVLSLPPPSVFDPEEDHTIDVVAATRDVILPSRMLRWRRKREQEKKVEEVIQIDPMRDVKCDVPCRWPDKELVIGKNFQINGTDWVINRNMEPPYNTPATNRVDPESKDLYFMTYSFKSDLPIPYFSWVDNKIKTEPVDYDKALPKANFIASHCGSKNDREKYVAGLQKYIEVDSLSACMKNARPPKGTTMGGSFDYNAKMNVMRQYRFHLAFENGNLDNYVTEKLWYALQAGTLPIYLGAPDIKEHAPPNSFIFANEFPSIDALGEYVRKVNENKTLYYQYHEWRRKDYPGFMVKKFNFTYTHGECRACRWAYAKKWGLSWDHDAQEIVEPAMLSPVCIDDATGLAIRPFREAWQSEGVEKRSVKQVASSDNCTYTELMSVWALGPYTVRRSLSEHENVIDLTVHIYTNGIGKPFTPLYVLLETGFKNNKKLFYINEEASSKGTKNAFIQNEVSRFTVLSDWDTEISNPKEGVIQILVYDGSRAILADEVVMRRIRILVEDHNKLHYKEGDTNASYFAKVVSDEFHRPLEYFYVSDSSHT